MKTIKTTSLAPTLNQILFTSTYFQTQTNILRHRHSDFSPDAAVILEKHWPPNPSKIVKARTVHSFANLLAAETYIANQNTCDQNNYLTCRWFELFYSYSISQHIQNHSVNSVTKSKPRNSKGNMSRKFVMSIYLQKCFVTATKIQTQNQNTKIIQMRSKSHVPCHYHSYTKPRLHTASYQTRVPGRNQRKLFTTPIDTATPNTIYTQQAAKPHARRHRRTFFAAPIGTATPNTVYTQQAAKPACQEDTAVHFSQLLLAQLPRTQFTHSKLPNPHARKTSPYIFRSSYWHSYPEHSLHTQQAAKPACQEDIAVHFSQLLLAQLPRTQFTHSKLPDPHASKTSPYIFRISYWHTYSEHSLHTASCQTQCQEDTAVHFSQVLLAQLPRTPFTHSKLPNPHARKTSPYSFRSSYWHSYPEHSLHTATCQIRMPGRHHRKIFAPPISTATPNTVYTQQGAKPACQEDITAICSHLLLAQLPRTQFTHSKLPNPHARKTPPQNFRTSYWHSYPEHSLHTARRQTRMPGRHHRNMFASPIGKATPNDVYTQHPEDQVRLKMAPK